MTSQSSGYGLCGSLAPVGAVVGWLLCAGFAVQPAAGGPMATSAAEADRANDRIAALIKDLGSQQYLVRQLAQEELRRLGPTAFDALAAAEHDRDIEIASRARYLVQLIRVDWVRDGDSPVVKRILRDYEFADEIQRTDKLQSLARLPQDIGLEPLCRLVRFEQSPAVSKQGALLVLQQKAKSSAEWRQNRQKIIEAALIGSKRPAARWLLTAALYERDPMPALEQWQRLVEEEFAAAGDTPSLTEQEVLQGLQQQHAIMLFRQSLVDQAKQVVRKVIEHSPDDAESLGKLVDWLIQQDALEMVDEVARRFEHRVNSNADLLYALAQVRRAQDKDDQAEELAARATSLLGDDATKHLRAAGRLQQRGQFDWSEREFRRTVEVADRESEITIAARIYLAELLFDIEREYDAAEALRSLNELMTSNGRIMSLVQDMERHKHVPARMHYYYACHYRKQSELDRMRKHLDDGIRFDPEDADILIAQYRDSSASFEHRKQTIAKIHTAAEQFRAQIAQWSADEPSYAANPYNQYAWLIANTEGDFDLALQYSHKSLELMPDTASYLDTLAHCYAAKRDFANAVTYQARAAELEPHTMQIQRSLTKFKSELQKSRDASP